MEEIEARLKALDAKLGVKPGPENSVWDRAPEWARFWARDPDGAAWFYELKPEWDETYQEWGVAGGMAGHDRSLEHSLASLSERPAGVEPEPVPEIDWSQAPDWARFAAMDEDGEWYWYGLKPRTCEDADCWFGGGRLDYYKETGCWVGWRSSLVERPEPAVEEVVEPEIDWERAPDWANWVAMDGDGEWHWYAVKPFRDDNLEYWYPDCNPVAFQRALIYDRDCPWDKSLVERPRPDPWSEDPDYPVSDWQFEVAMNDTRLGYREWVSHQREAHDQTPD
jgi:hypothetical protein